MKERPRRLPQPVPLLASGSAMGADGVDLFYDMRGDRDNLAFGCQYKLDKDLTVKGKARESPRFRDSPRFAEIRDQGMAGIRRD